MSYKTELRVRYSETDRSGAVYFSNFFIWMDFAVAEYFRSLGLYEKFEKKKLSFVVRECSASFLSPARYHDLLTISLEIGGKKEKSISFLFRVLRGEEPIAEGKIIYVFTDLERKKAVSIPPEILEVLK
jgi:acyl-CoA thioester hydrolase